MLQVCKNTNAPPEKGPDFSSQVSTGLVLKNPEIFFRNRAPLAVGLGEMGGL
jgi:hypothetical protein